MIALREFLVKVLAPILWRFMYDNKDDFIRYARVVLNSKVSVVWFVIQKKLGLSPNAVKIIQDAVIEIVDGEEVEIAKASIKDFQVIPTKDVYVIDQSRNVYTLLACVPTSLYLNWCRSTITLPSWKEYIEILNYLEDQNVWDPKGGANTDKTAKSMEAYLNKKYPEKQVEITRGYRKNDDVIEGATKWYIATVTYKNNTNFYADRNNNRIIDNDRYAGSSTWGHCVRASLGATVDPSKVQVLSESGIRDYIYDNDLVSWKDTDVIILDNYPDRSKFNNFYVHNRLEAHMKNGLFSSSSYFFKPLFKIEKEEETPETTFNSYQYAIDNGITNGKDPEKELVRREGAMMTARVHKDLNEKIVAVAKEVAKLKK